MKPIRLTLIAIATALSIGTANADESRATEVIIVTAPKPEPIEISKIVEPALVEARIDYTKLAIEPPRLDPSTVRRERNIELARGEETRSKS